MVAYSFKSQFAEPIEQRRKCQTIRADRKRHARPCERLQLYVGMRTKHCRKIIPDPVCTFVDKIYIIIDGHSIHGIDIDGLLLDPPSMEKFARHDGFASLDEMHKFWVANHGPKDFQGVIITWKDQP